MAKIGTNNCTIGCGERY